MPNKGCAIQAMRAPHFFMKNRCYPINILEKTVNQPDVAVNINNSTDANIIFRENLKLAKYIKNVGRNIVGSKR
jgi:hypothetical protein